MKNRLNVYIYLIVALLIWAVSAPLVAADQIQWYSYEEGMALGASERKKVFLNFHADWCKFCETMDRQTFKDAGIISYLNSNFISIKVDDHGGGIGAAKR